jgi:predicted aspartyl protease
MASPIFTFVSLAAALALGSSNLLAQPAPPAINGSPSYIEALTFAHKRQFDEAKQSLRRLDETNPAQLAEKLAVESWIEFFRCRFDTSEAKARAALAANPQQPLALMVMSRLLAAKNQLPEAIAHGKAAAQADPNHPLILWRAQGAYAYHPNDAPQRQALLEKIIALGGSPEIPNGAAAALNSLKNSRLLGARRTNTLAPNSTQMQVPLLTDATRRFQVDIPLPDGGTTRAMLDTGATALILAGDAGNSFKKEVLSEQSVFTIQGESKAQTVLLESLTIGAMKWNTVNASTGGKFRESLLGTNLFRETVLVVDFKRGRLQAYADAAQFDREWAAQLTGATRAPFYTTGGFICVPCTVAADNSSEQRGVFVLDTGANNTTLSKRFVGHWRKELGVRVDDIPARQIGGAADRGQVVNQAVANVTIHVGALKFSHPQMGVMEFDALQQEIGADFAVLMGTDQLTKVEFVVIDFIRRAVYFGPQR